MGWRGKWKTEVGGPTMSLGIHLMDLLLWLLDAARSAGLTATLDHTIEVEDISMALVRFGSGAIGDDHQQRCRRARKATFASTFRRRRSK